MKFILRIILLAAVLYVAWWYWNNYDVEAWFQNCKNAPRQRKTTECAMNLPKKRMSESGFSQNTVYIKNCEFSPQYIQVDTNTRVIWINQDASDQEIIGPDFDSGLINPNKEYSKTFSQPGTYIYSCADSQQNVGQIIVK